MATAFDRTYYGLDRAVAYLAGTSEKVVSALWAVTSLDNIIILFTLSTVLIVVSALARKVSSVVEKAGSKVIPLERKSDIRYIDIPNVS